MTLYEIENEYNYLRSQVLRKLKRSDLKKMGLSKQRVSQLFLRNTSLSTLLRVAKDVQKFKVTSDGREDFGGVAPEQEQNGCEIV